MALFLEKWFPVNDLMLLTTIFFNIILQSFITFVAAVGPACRCIIFDDTYGKEYGVFTSPNWPTPYEDNTDCFLYTFLAKEDQIVEITFDEFDVQKTNLDCIFGDFVKLYLHLRQDGLTGDIIPNTVLCGKITDIEQTHYSSSSSLIFEFHSDWRNGNNTGFRGTYRFLSKRLFDTDGELIASTKCDYNFESFSIVNVGNVTTQRMSTVSRSNRGRFYSPQYPSTYPKNTQCSYRFNGQPLERIKIVFEHIRLQKSDLSCLNSPDVISVHDGQDRTSPVIETLCNTKTFVEVVSSGSNLYIEFISRSHFPGQGYKGRFFFESPHNSSPDGPSTEPENFNNKGNPQQQAVAEGNSGEKNGNPLSCPLLPGIFYVNLTFYIQNFKTYFMGDCHDIR